MCSLRGAKMNCPKCTNEMIEAKATAFGEAYQYCRICKKELKEIESAVITSALAANILVDETNKLTKRTGVILGYLGTNSKGAYLLAPTFFNQDQISAIKFLIPLIKQYEHSSLPQVSVTVRWSLRGAIEFNWYPLTKTLFPKGLFQPQDPLSREVWDVAEYISSNYYDLFA